MGEEGIGKRRRRGGKGNGRHHQKAEAAKGKEGKNDSLWGPQIQYTRKIPQILSVLA